MNGDSFSCPIQVRWRDLDAFAHVNNARVTISGKVHQVARTEEEYPRLRDAYIDRFPISERTFMLGDFYLYKLQFERGRLVAGFARAVNLRPESFAELSLP